MGFFSSDDKPAPPPNKVKRKECWEKRDAFFECLTKNNIDNLLDPKSEKKVASLCGNERTAFENKCVASWFKYFQEKRFSDLVRQRYIAKLEAEGAQELPFKLGTR